MKGLTCLSVPVLSLALAGCGEKSDELPVDGRDFDGVEYGEAVPYTGKVIDGYLSHARVWLDMDGDGQVTPGPLTMSLGNGREVVLPSGEPTTLSGAGGVFSLDVTELSVGTEVGPDLDPRDYPLYALVLPDKTLEETPNGPAAVSDAFMMSAPPGVRNITPLTTLARYRGVAAQTLDSDITISASLADLNLLRDYLLAGDERAHAYARALARFMASQFPEEFGATLATPESEGTERYLGAERGYPTLLGVSLVQNAADVVGLVDEAAQGNYANLDVDSLELPDVPLKLSDPVLLTRLRVFAEPDQAETLPANRLDLVISAELAFDYTEEGRLLSVSANGCLAPSMPELARLIGVNGYMDQLGTQWLPSASLSPQSRIHYEETGTDERLLFDWDKQRIYFETRTTCHDHEGISAGSTELGGNPEITYSWTMQKGELTELVANIPQSGANNLKRTLVPAGTNTEEVSNAYPGYHLAENGSALASLVLSGGVSRCAADKDALETGLVVTARQSYEFSGYDPQPGNFQELAYEFDDRTMTYPSGDGSVKVDRLLRYGFLDPAMSDLARVDQGSGFEWILFYPPVGGNGFYEKQPNLITRGYLKAYSGSGQCGREFEGAPTDAYARVEYGYQRLSGYMIGLLD